MFLGSHEHTIDNKGRLTMPSKWRAELSSQVVVTRGLDGCLSIFPYAKFEEIAKQIDTQGIMLAETRLWARYMSGAADAIEVDGQGRVLIPQKLREYANLNGNVVVVGLVSRIEVWNPDKFKAISEQVESDAVAVSQKMGEMMVSIANSIK